MNYLVTILFIFLINDVNSYELLGNKKIKSEKIEINCSNIPDGQYAITAQAEFDKLFVKSNYNCGIFNFSQIDFSKNILLGVTAAGGGCKIPEYSYSIFQGDSAKTILELNITEFGFCEINRRHSFWILYSRENISSEDIVFKIKRNYIK